MYFDEEGRRCENERIEIVELEQEVPPDTTAGIFWLKNRKPEQWNKQIPKIEDDRNNTEPPKTLTKEEAKDFWNKLDNEY